MWQWWLLMLAMPVVSVGAGLVFRRRGNRMLAAHPERFRCAVRAVDKGVGGLKKSLWWYPGVGTVVAGRLTCQSVTINLREFTPTGERVPRRIEYVMMAPDTVVLILVDRAGGCLEVAVPTGPAETVRAALARN